MTMKIRRLEYFLGVAEELHFTRAARRLRVAQPHLSQEIQRLEQELGVALFHRTQRTVSLTPAGAIFAEEVRRALDGITAAVVSAQRVARGQMGRLRVGFPGLTAGHIPDAIRAYRAALPEVKLELFEMPTGEQVEAIRAGRIDLGIVVLPITRESQRLVLEPLWHERLVAAVPRQHPLANADRIALEQLAAEPWVMFPYSVTPGYSGHLYSLCAKAGFTPEVVQEARQWATLVSLVVAGIGVTIVSEPVTRFWPGDVHYCRFHDPEPEIEIAALLPGGHVIPTIAPFIDMLRNIAAAREQRSHTLSGV